MVVLVFQYLMEFNSSPGDLIQLSSLFSDDKRVAEAASIAQKLRMITSPYNCPTTFLQVYFKNVVTSKVFGK